MFVSPLESRRLLSAVLASDGVLTVTGTDHSDHISVTHHTTTHHDHHHGPHHSILVVENGHSTEFDPAAVTRVVIEGGAGGDSLAAFHLSRPVKINGGDGNDFLYGGNLSDALNGAAGNDFLYGGAGNDTLDGGAGRDFLGGGSGDDMLLARDGELDVLNGGDGHDVAVVDHHRPHHPHHPRHVYRDRLVHVEQVLLIAPV